MSGAEVFENFAKNQKFQYIQKYGKDLVTVTEVENYLFH